MVENHQLAQTESIEHSKAEECELVEQIATAVSTTTEASSVANEPDWKEEHGRLCQVFNDWCFSNGVV